MEELEGEIWKPIPGYETEYEISNHGRVYSLTRGKIRSMSVMNKYYSTGLSKVGTKPKMCRIHRMVAIVFIPNPEGKPQINHKDCNKLNNHVSNLEWCTGFENAAHAKINNRLKPHQGTKQWRSVFDDIQVKTIKLCKRDGISTADLAAYFGVAKSTIRHINNGYTWRHIKI